jgi:hypothetical protein
MFPNSSVIFQATRRAGSFSGVGCGRAFGLLLGLLGLPACSDGTYLTDGVVQINTGQESSDVWTAEPAAKDVLVEMVEGTKRTTLARVPAPATSISIGTGGPSYAVASFEATAFDSSANAVMKGTSVQLGVFGFEDAVVPLFMGRTGGLSRGPGSLVSTWRHPQVAVLYHAYLLISGGDDASAELDVYDMARWVAAPKQQKLPKVPLSWAVSGAKLLLIDHSGGEWLDMSKYETSDVVPPGELDYESIVGGETVGSPGDPQYIVGATRAKGEATDQVLRVDADGSLHLMKLNTPRLGASATIVNGQLLVVGGSDTGAGAEISNAAGTEFTDLPFESDAKEGAALVALDDNTVMLAGGRVPQTDDEISGFRSMDLTCAENCSQLEIANADFAFTHPRLFSLSASQLLAVGEDPTTEETHVFTFDTGIGHALTEFALRTPRKQASAVLLPNGQVGVLGGLTIEDASTASSVELFFPQL